MIENEITTCKNCDTKFEGNFCNNCGQSANIKPINRHFVLTEISETIIKINSGFFFTIKELFRNPGRMIHNYIDGKRIKYFRPITFLLILVTIYTFIEHSVNRKTFLEKFLFDLRNFIFEGRYANSNMFKIFSWLTDHGGYTLLLTIPIFSVASYLAFYSSKNNFFKHLVLNNYLFGQIVFIYILLSIIPFITNNKVILTYYDISLDVIVTGYNFYVYYQYFDNYKPFTRILRTCLTNLFLYVIFLVLIIFIAIFL